MKKHHYVYCSYEQWGRSYIGKRTCKCLPEEDTSYFGSFSDKTFKPTEKIILASFDSSEEAFEAERALHVFFQVDENPHFANQHIQGFYSKFTHPKGSYWVNNGYENKFIKPWEPIPKGFVKGKMPLGYKSSPEYLLYKMEQYRQRQRKAVEAAQKEEARLKRIASLKAINHQQRETNSQFGTRFIHNPATKRNTRISKKDPLPEGWIEGAKFSNEPRPGRRKKKKAEATPKEPKVKLKSDSAKELDKTREERDRERQARISRLRELYSIYLEGGFQAVREAGYDKSQVNLVQQFAKYIPEFVPQNGKRRGKPKEQG